MGRIPSASLPNRANALLLLQLTDWHRPAIVCNGGGLRAEWNWQMNNHVPLALCHLFPVRSQKRLQSRTPAFLLFFTIYEFRAILFTCSLRRSRLLGNTNSVSFFLYFSFSRHHVQFIVALLIRPASFWLWHQQRGLPTSHLIALWPIRQKRATERETGSKEFDGSGGERSADDAVMTHPRYGNQRKRTENSYLFIFLNPEIMAQK